MNDKNKELIDGFKRYLELHFKGYSISISTLTMSSKGDVRVVVFITLYDATRIQLPAFTLGVEALQNMAECLEVNRNKIMYIQE